MRHSRHVDAGAAAFDDDAFALRIVADARKQGDGNAEPRQVLGDISGDAAEAGAHPAYIGGVQAFLRIGGLADTVDHTASQA